MWFTQYLVNKLLTNIRKFIPVIDVDTVVKKINNTDSINGDLQIAKSF